MYPHTSFAPLLLLSLLDPNAASAAFASSDSSASATSTSSASSNRLLPVGANPAPPDPSPAEGNPWSWHTGTWQRAMSTNMGAGPMGVGVSQVRKEWVELAPALAGVYWNWGVAGLGEEWGPQEWESDRSVAGAWQERGRSVASGYLHPECSIGLPTVLNSTSDVWLRAHTKLRAPNPPPAHHSPLPPFPLPPFSSRFFLLPLRTPAP